MGDLMKWVLAVDGGGTKTAACAGDLAGNVLGRLEKGPANYHTIGLENFGKLIGNLVDECCALYSLNRQELALISLGLAGVDRPGDRERILGVLNGLGLSCGFLISNDARVALAAGLEEPAGIALIAGTGSIAYGITPEGVTVRAGGWGHLISDEGSGYDIGRLAVSRGIKALEGRDRPTLLLANILAHLRLENLDELIQYIYNPANTKAALAALSQVVADAADEGDAVAAEIIENAAGSLAALVESVLERGFPGETGVPVCTYGGIVDHIPQIKNIIAARLAGKARLVKPETEPVMGALKLGYDHLKKEAMI
jgi:N-acetylglucosamine kinase-like BadF-type ATPase